MNRRHRSSGLAVVVAAAVIGSAPDLSAQAICSAPHSSPSLAQSGAISTLPAGAAWVQASFLGQRAREGFNPLGDRQPFVGGSTFRTQSAYLTGAWGVVEGLEVWAQLPVHRLTVEGAAGRSEGSGVGDFRASVRLSPRLVGVDLPFTVRAGLKLPGRDLPVDARVLPVTEGQRDLEVSVESGVVFPNYPVYLVGWVGYRWRGENVSERFEPGDERFAHLALGGQWSGVSLEVGVDAMWGKAPVDEGLLLDSGRRRLVQLLPTVGVDAGPGRIELTTPVPMSGRNLPAGPGLGLGYRLVRGVR